MFNELLFFAHIFLVVVFLLGSIKLGKEALSAWIIIQAFLANLFVLKQISFFTFQITCSDVFAVGSILGLNLLQEYYGKEAAKKACWTCFYALIFFALMSQLHLLYIPSSFDSAHDAFSLILSPTPRLTIASLGVFFLVQQFDLRFFGYLKKYIRSPFTVNILALVTSQFLDTVLFSFFGLYGLVASLLDVIFISFLIKCLIISLLTPLTLLSKRYVPNL